MCRGALHPNLNAFERSVTNPAALEDDLRNWGLKIELAETESGKAISATQRDWMAGKARIAIEATMIGAAEGQRADTIRRQLERLVTNPNQANLVFAGEKVAAIWARSEPQRVDDRRWLVATQHFQGEQVLIEFPDQTLMPMVVYHGLIAAGIRRAGEAPVWMGVSLFPASSLRASARLLHAPVMGAFEDCVVRDAPKLVRAGDLLVFNDTRVIPARLKGERHRGENVVEIEATLLRRMSPSLWSALAKPGKRLKEGDRLHFSAHNGRSAGLGTLDATVESKDENGVVVLRFDLTGPGFDQLLAAVGEMPLPPYIAGRRSEDAGDQGDYQTVYAARDGAVAAPTAGLHFTDALLGALDAAGVERRHVTLHVGAGTFLPVKVDDTEDHVMHSEWREISPEVAEAVNRAKAEGRRVIAVGTTALRSLESAADESGRVHAGSGDTDIFITPGYRFRVVDGLWTNFHLPRSTLFMLVSAFAGLERMQAVYAHAIANGYRFYSYGDASLLWRAE